MVAEHGTGQRGGQCHGDERRIKRLGDRHDDGDENTEGAPGGAGGETQEGRDDENDGGQESGRDAAGRDRVLHEGGRGQKVAADAAEGPGQHEDDVGGHHVLHALNASVQEILHGHEAARHKLQESHGKGAEGSPDQSLGG